MLAVGITGAPSSGKSSVLRLLRRLGARVVDCDRIVHARLKAGTPEHRRIAARWGGAVLTGGRLDRRKLRAAVLGKPGALAFLERTLHPAVRREVARRIRAARRAGGVIAVEVPLLFETGFDRLVDRTVAVTARAGARAGRAAARGMGPRELDFFSKRQWPGRRKAARADYVIRNDGTPRELARRVRDLYARLARESLSARGRPRGGKP